jgi:two-component system sensor histidine kinase/response regulator
MLIEDSEIKILLVDDDKGLLTIVKTVVEKSGAYSVTTDINGEDAWKRITEDTPDVVVSDYMMPILDGQGLLTRIRESKNTKIHDLYFMMLTAKTDDSSKVGSLSRGADDYVTKPYNIQELIARIKVGVKLKKMHRSLIQINDQKDEILGMVAHDLRNPISIIRGISELFEYGTLGELNEDGKEFMKTVHRQTQSMLELINDLLHATKIDSGKIDLNLSDLKLRKVLEDKWQGYVMQSNHKKITIENNIDADLPLILGDENRLGNVMDNFLSNAIKFSSEGDSVTVSSEVIDGMVKISVSDTGQGIPEDELDKLFSEFAKISSKPTAGETSSGLGLAIFKKLIALHGGDVGATSVLGEGSTFFFTLPVRPAG